MSYTGRKIKDILKVNAVHLVFYGYVNRMLNTEPILTTAKKFVNEIDDSLEPETLVRRYYEVLEFERNIKKSK